MLSVLPVEAESMLVGAAVPPLLLSIAYALQRAYRYARRAVHGDASHREFHEAAITKPLHVDEEAASDIAESQVTHLQQTAVLVTAETKRIQLGSSPRRSERWRDRPQTQRVIPGESVRCVPFRDRPTILSRR